MHLADKGNPVVGDKIYGEKDKRAKRLGLHASSLIIQHPFTKEKMTFEAEVPVYFKNLLQET